MMLRCACGHPSHDHIGWGRCIDCADCHGFIPPTDQPALVRFSDGRCTVCGVDHPDDTDCAPSTSGPVGIMVRELAGSLPPLIDAFDQLARRSRSFSRALPLVADWDTADNGLRGLLGRAGFNLEPLPAWHGPTRRRRGRRS